MHASSSENSDETRLLLSAQIVDDNPDTIQAKPITPLPKAKLTIATCIRIVEPIAFSQIFPYINEYLSSLHVTDDPKQIGFYSGLVESTFAVFQLVSIYNLSKLSDRIGRRPVILWGNAGIAVATLLFGLSRSLPTMLVFRAMAGLCSGNAPVMHSVIAEITDSTNFGLALPIYSSAWPIGAVIGAMLGGTLSSPADKYPWLNFSFLVRHPYFLPGGVASALTFLAVLIGYFVLEETLPSKIRTSKELHEIASAELVNDRPRDEPLGAKALLANPAMVALCTSGSVMCFQDSGFQVVFVLFAYTSVLNGGLGLSTESIGYSLSTSAVACLILQLMIVPYLIRTFNHAKIYNLCFWVFPFTFPLLAVLNLIARAGYDRTTGELSSQASAAIWVGIAIVMAMARIANLAYSFNIIIIKENCPNSASLGMSNGIVQFTMCLARALSPAFTSSIFALSVDYNILGGFAWLIATFLVGLLGIIESRSLICLDRHRR
ncbi:MFS general substrate transporter [Athelia psychrophila]|uniref:MFS general substrate transporter n=1 Tax=Athelia psychrophila TaxID=1759441 RepID=A0A166Q9G6_9AGAM|nr:MFS general substrate transporter [Fibularhizoctonia sp. CBS 109695]